MLGEARESKRMQIVAEVRLYYKGRVRPYSYCCICPCTFKDTLMNYKGLLNIRSVVSTSNFFKILYVLSGTLRTALSNRI